MRKKATYFFILTLFVFLFFLASNLNALTALPKLGIDYQQMQVKNPNLLRKTGMKNPKMGDKVKIKLTEEHNLLIINKRNNNKLNIDLENYQKKTNQK